jgi:microcin C transport system permease protein
MLSYIIRRLLLIIPTLWAIITINFFVVQVAPGGPVEQMVAEMRGIRTNTRLERLSGITADEVTPSEQEEESSSAYRGARGLDPEVIEEIKRRFGFDRPLHVR